MSDEDKLRFELTGGFNKLSEDELKNIEKEFFSHINCDESIIEGLNFRIAAVKFLKKISKYYNDEEFIQIVVLIRDVSLYGYALTLLKDKEVIPYAKEYLKNNVADLLGYNRPLDTTTNRKLENLLKSFGV